MSRPWSGITTLVRGLEFSGNVRILAITSMSTGVYVTMLTALLQPFVVTSLGYSVFILGIMVAIGARPTGLASSIVQPFAGHLADLIGRKPLIVLGSSVGVGSMVSFLFAAATHSLLAVGLGYLLFGLALLGYPASQATIAESVAMDERKVRVAFSVVFFFTFLPGVIAPAIGGYVAGTLGYLVLFVVAALLESANLAILVTSLRETHPRRSNGAPGPASPGFSFRQALRIPRSQFRLFVPFAMDSFSYGLGGAIIFGMWSSAFGLSATAIGLVASTLSASVAASQFLATKLLLRLGTRKTLALSEFLTVVVLSGWLFAPTLPIILLMAAIFGVSVSTWLPSVSSFLMAVAPVEERGSINGKMAVIRGLIGAPAPFIGGAIFAAFGYYVPVALSLAGETLTVVALLKLLPR